MHEAMFQMHLVEERRVEQRVVGEAGRDRRVGPVDLEAPRQVGRQAEQLLVEVVAEPAERLRDQQAGDEASANAQNRRPAMRQPMQQPIAPPSSVPKMAMPPSQIVQDASMTGPCCPGPK